MSDPTIQGNRTPIRPPLAPAPVAAKPGQIEVDVSLRAKDSRMHVEGDVFIGHRLLPALIRKALTGPDIRNVDIQYRPAEKRFVMSGEAKFAGTFWKGSGATKVDVDGHDIVLRNVTFDFPGAGFDFISNKVRDAIVSELKNTRIDASRDGKDIRIDMTSLLKEAGVMPPWASLMDDTTSNVSTDQAGNLAVHFGPGETGKPNGVSHIKAALDPATSDRVIQAAFGSQFVVGQTSYNEGSLHVKGRTNVPELVDAINVGGAFLNLARYGLAGLLGDVTVTKVMVPLELNLRPEGTHLVIRPSLKAAVAPIATELGKSGGKVEATKDEVRIDAGAMLPNGTLQRVAVTPGGLEFEADIKLDGILHPDLR